MLWHINVFFSAILAAEPYNIHSACSFYFPVKKNKPIDLVLMRKADSSQWGRVVEENLTLAMVTTDWAHCVTVPNSYHLFEFLSHHKYVWWSHLCLTSSNTLTHRIYLYHFTKEHILTISCSDKGKMYFFSIVQWTLHNSNITAPPRTMQMFTSPSHLHTHTFSGLYLDLKHICTCLVIHIPNIDNDDLISCSWGVKYLNTADVRRHTFSPAQKWEELNLLNRSSVLLGFCPQHKEVAVFKLRVGVELILGRVVM